jgi:hypothetical protein
LSGRGDICAFSGARGIAAILEKSGCDHVKTLAQAEATLSIEDTKDPSAEASLIAENSLMTSRRMAAEGWRTR